jgi:heme oxygenase (biliverdin-producing, ferredoxin)
MPSMETGARLSEALRAQTRRLHAEVERSDFMTALMRGRADRVGYCALLRSLQVIYATLEPALARHRAHPAIAAILLPQLARSDLIAADLQALHGPDWQRELIARPAALEYAERLSLLDASRPTELVAHAYVRYLGDLSGGQLLRRAVSAALRLQGGEGVRFYTFAPGVSAKSLATRFREGLDAISLGRTELAAIVAEAQLGFALHRRLFQQLASEHPAYVR